ncbi:hypothetical protein AB1Y20_007026 [Prymnesium parvum]|uniref:Uncharacterized protein n=1 Tax=Prymnesium parvum TaxID=97485 RepID=A0AB34J051_PRYPA
MAACRGRRNNYRPELPCAHLLISAPSTAPPPLPSVSAPAVAFPPTAQPQSIPDASAWVDPAASLGPRYAQQRRMIPPRPPTYHPEVTALIARFHERGWLPRTFSGDAAAAAAAALGASTLSDTHRQAAAHLFSLKVTVELMQRLREQLYRMCDSMEGKEAQLLELEATMGSTVQHELQSLFEEITKASGVRIVSDPGTAPSPSSACLCLPSRFTNRPPSTSLLSGRVSVGLAPPPASPHHPKPQLDSSPPQEDVAKAPCGDEEDRKEREGVAEATAPAPSLPSLSAAPSTRSVMSASAENQGVLAPSEPVDPKGKRNLSRRPVRASAPSASAAGVAAPAPSTPSSLTERILLMRLVDQVALQLSHLEPKKSSEGAILAAVASISGIRAATLWIREKAATGSPSLWLEAATWRGIGSGEVTVPAAIPSSIWAAQA